MDTSRYAQRARCEQNNRRLFAITLSSQQIGRFSIIARTKGHTLGGDRYAGPTFGA